MVAPLLKVISAASAGRYSILPGAPRFPQGPRGFGYFEAFFGFGLAAVMGSNAFAATSAAFASHSAAISGVITGSGFFAITSPFFLVNDQVILYAVSWA